MLKRLNLPPGINRESTEYAAEGAWYDSNNIRFRGRYAESIGGWIQDGTYTVEGIARGIFSWTTYAGFQYNVIGTNWKYYLTTGNQAVDITPIRVTTSAGDVEIDATNGSNIIDVTDPSHGAVENDFVTFSGATAIGTTITADILNSEHQIQSVPDGNSYKIKLSVESDATGDAGGSVVGEYQVNVGLATQSEGAGWGVGVWGRQGWSNPAVTSMVTGVLRLLSIDNYNEDLMFCNRGGPIYYWDTSTATSDGVPNSNGSERAKDIGSFSGSRETPTVVQKFLVSDRDGHVIAFGCNDWGGSAINTLLVRWSDQNDFSDWEPRVGNTAGGQMLRVGSEIIAALSTKSEILIWTDSALYSMRFVGPPNVFSFNLISENVRCLTDRSAINVSNVVYFMGKDGFYVYSGSVSPLPSTVDKYVYHDINLEQRGKIFSASNAAYNEVYWFYPSSGSIEPDRYVVYNYGDNVWSIGSFDMSSVSLDTSNSTSNARTAWTDSVVFTYPLAPFIYNWDDTQSPPIQKCGVMAHENGVTANNAPLVTSIESGDVEISQDDRYAALTRIYPDIQFLNAEALSFTPTVKISVNAKDFPGSPESSINTSEVMYSASTGNYGVGNSTPSGNATAIRGRGRAMSVKFSCENTRFKWRLGDTRIEMRPDGRR